MRKTCSSASPPRAGTGDTGSAAPIAGLPVRNPMALIRLNVYSALDGVGLTAAVAGALAEAGIACNMVAALNHDHVFVPADRATQALSILRALQAAANAP